MNSDLGTLLTLSFISIIILKSKTRVCLSILIPNNIVKNRIVKIDFFNHNKLEAQLKTDI